MIFKKYIIVYFNLITSYNITMVILMDQNKRLDCILQYCKELPCQRVADIALPFLSLNPKTAICASVGISIYQSSIQIPQIASTIKNRKWMDCGKKSFQLGSIVASVAFSFFAPTMHCVVSNALCLTYRVGQLSAHLWQHEWKKGGLVSLQITHQVIHIASLYYGTAAWIVVSLVSQAAFELYQAIEFASAQRKPEAWAFIILAMIRLNTARAKISVGRSLTQTEWNNIYSQIKRKSHHAHHDVKSLLTRRGISCYIQNIDFTETSDLSKLVFKDLHFQRCNFSGVRFNRSEFYNITANHCNFCGVSWIQSELNRFSFYNCQIKNAALFNSHLNDISMTDCDLTLLCFNDSLINNLIITRGCLLETSFLHAKVTQGKLIDCNLIDALLLDAKENFEIRGGIPHQMTRPIVALGWHFNEPGYYTSLISKALRSNNVIPLYYEQKSPDINQYRLDNEIQAGLAQISPPLLLSIPHEILHQAQKDSEIYKVQEKAASILKHCQALALPGGDDIEIEFYGDTYRYCYNQISETHRSVLDFAILSCAEKNKIPTMGICRGAQLINVWRGGTLRDIKRADVSLQTATLADSIHSNWLREIAGCDELTVHSNHHQAVNEVGQGLHVILTYNDVPKFLVSEDGLLIASQVHPEWYITLSSNLESERILANGQETWLEFKEKQRAIYQYFVKKIQPQFNQQTRQNLDQDLSSLCTVTLLSRSSYLAEKVRGSESIAWLIFMMKKNLPKKFKLQSRILQIWTFLSGDIYQFLQRIR
jgi:gamma-glutamyl-gamma-aminobutyrate hydrolase PuuD